MNPRLHWPIRLASRIMARIPNCKPERKMETKKRPSSIQWLMVILVAWPLLPCAVAAQSLTGALIGTVKDEQGAVIPGALVRATSPALIGGPATMITPDTGQLRFPVLAPGAYVLDIGVGR